MSRKIKISRRLEHPRPHKVSAYAISWPFSSSFRPQLKRILFISSIMLNFVISSFFVQNEFVQFLLISYCTFTQTALETRKVSICFSLVHYYDDI